MTREHAGILPCCHWEHLGIKEKLMVVRELKGLVAIAPDGGSSVGAGSLYCTELEADSLEHFLP